MGRYFLNKLPKYLALSCIIYSSLFFILGPNVYADDVTITWQPNGEGDLAGYKLYWGKTSRNYPNNVDVGNKITYTISGLNNGETYYFAVTAYDTSNNESIYSNEVVYTTSDTIGGGESGGGEDSGGGGGCFIAAAAYGSPMEHHVKILREFRDNILLNGSIGKAFVHGYYIYSPPIAGFISEHPNLRVITRVSLLPIVGMIWVALKIGPVYSLVFVLFLGFGLICFKKFKRRIRKNQICLSMQKGLFLPTN